MFKMLMLLLVLGGIIFITSPYMSYMLSHLLDGTSLVSILHVIGTSFK